MVSSLHVAMVSSESAIFERAMLISMTNDPKSSQWKTRFAK
jgi:hypothetical protein